MTEDVIYSKQMFDPRFSELTTKFKVDTMPSHGQIKPNDKLVLCRVLQRGSTCYFDFYDFCHNV